MKTKKFVKKIVKEFENEKLIVELTKTKNYYTILVSDISYPMFDIIAHYKGNKLITITNYKDRQLKISIYRNTKCKN